MGRLKDMLTQETERLMEADNAEDSEEEWERYSEIATRNLMLEQAKKEVIEVKSNAISLFSGIERFEHAECHWTLRDLLKSD